MPAAVNCFVSDPSRNLPSGMFRNIPLDFGEAVPFIDQQLPVPGNEHCTHKGLVGHVGLNDLLHARSGILRLSQAGNANENRTIAMKRCNMEYPP